MKGPIIVRTKGTYLFLEGLPRALIGTPLPGHSTLRYLEYCSKHDLAQLMSYRETLTRASGRINWVRHPGKAEESIPFAMSSD